MLIESCPDVVAARRHDDSVVWVVVELQDVAAGVAFVAS